MSIKFCKFNKNHKEKSKMSRRRKNTGKAAGRPSTTGDKPNTEENTIHKMPLNEILERITRVKPEKKK